jgi:hypothetical protein
VQQTLHVLFIRRRASVEILVRAGTPPFEKKIDVYSLTYDCRQRKFVMPAGGYLLATNREYQPEELHVQWNALFVTFRVSEDAQAFLAWLEDADARAQESFTRMPD